MTDKKRCDVCDSSAVELSTRQGFVGGWQWIWLCFDCGASVGCHPDTTTPLGLMAAPRTRYLRNLAHESFDPIWRTGLMSRERAKRWAAGQLGIIGEFHISWLDDRQLETLIALAQKYMMAKQPNDLFGAMRKEKERKQRPGQRQFMFNRRQAERRKGKR